MHARGKSGDEFSDDSQKVDGPPFDRPVPSGESVSVGYRKRAAYYCWLVFAWLDTHAAVCVSGRWKWRALEAWLYTPLVVIVAHGIYPSPGLCIQLSRPVASGWRRFLPCGDEYLEADNLCIIIATGGRIIIATWQASARLAEDVIHWHAFHLQQD